MEQLEEIFESWGDIFSKESERPYVEHKESNEDYSNEFLKQLK